MKIPKRAQTEEREKIKDAFKNAATKYSLEYGIFIQVCGDYYKDVTTKDISSLSEIFFYLDGHAFHSLKELRKALRNKAFL